MTRRATSPGGVVFRTVIAIVATARLPALIVGLFVTQLQADRDQAHGILGEFTVSSCVRTDPGHADFRCTGAFRANHQSLELTAISMETRVSPPAGTRIPAYVTGPHVSTAGQRFNPATEQIDNVLLSVGLVAMLIGAWVVLIRYRRRRRGETLSMALDGGGSPATGA